MELLKNPPIELPRTGASFPRSPQPQHVRLSVTPTGNSDTSEQSWDWQGAWKSEIRHLTFHLFATHRHDGWKWNLEQLAKRWKLFNGTTIVAIAIDNKTHSADYVRDYLQSIELNFDHILVLPNDPIRREVATWLPMLRLLNPETAGENEVVFACHAKGVRHDDMSETLTRWTQCMYESCLDFWPLVEAQLSSKIATGSFKRYGTFNTPGNNRWHYSGTFFWWRLSELGKRNWQKVDQQFFGTESWLGHQCVPEETGVLFCDFTDDLYYLDYWEREVCPNWLKWKLAAEQSRVAIIS